MRSFLFAVAALAACSAPADVTRVGNIEISGASASPSPNGVDVAAGYLMLTNKGDTDERLVAASSPRAAHVELHNMEMDGAVMRMRQVEAVTIPAHGEVALAPGGDHLMFMGVTEPFQSGETIPVQLTFEHAGPVDLTLTVGQPSHH